MMYEHNRDNMRKASYTMIPCKVRLVLVYLWKMLCLTGENQLDPVDPVCEAAK